MALGALLALISFASAAPRPNGGGGPLWSPDGLNLVFVAATPNTAVDLWRAAWTGQPGLPQRVTTQGARLVAWAPDGQSLLYRTYRGGAAAIYRASLDGTPDRPELTWLPANAAAVVPSPDGKQVAYTVSAGGTRDLWVAAGDGSNPHQLTTKHNVRLPAWRPGHNELAFDAGGAYGEAVFVADAGGGEPRQIFAGVGSYPSWSPDGQWLVLLGMHSATLVSADGSKQQRLHLSQDERGPLSWSPDSKSIAYAAAMGATWGLSVVEAATGKMQTLTKDWARTGGAQWSPDGRAIAFEGLKLGEVTPNVHVLTLADKRVQRLTQSKSSDWGATLSGDGKALFFQSNRGAQGGVVLCRRWLPAGAVEALLPLDARLSVGVVWPRQSTVGLVVHGATIWLLDGRDKPKPLVKTEHPTAADISPTGDRLLYVKWLKHRPSLVVRQLADGTEKEVLGAPTAAVAYSKVAWSPHGESALFVRGDTLCRLRLSDGAVTEIMSAGAGGTLLHPLWSPGGGSFVVGRFVSTPERKLEIWVIGASGEGQRLVSATPIGGERGWLSDPLSQPYAWSASRRLAYCVEDGGTTALHLADLSAGEPRTVLLRAAAAYPEWSADGRELLYTDLSGYSEILRQMPLPPPM